MGFYERGYSYLGCTSQATQNESPVCIHTLLEADFGSPAIHFGIGCPNGSPVGDRHSCIRASPAEPLLKPSSYFWGSEVKKLTPAGSLLKPSNSRGLWNHPFGPQPGGSRQGPQLTIGAGSDIQVNCFVWLYVDDYVIWFAKMLWTMLWSAIIKFGPNLCLI
jgi:hypothetical protein